MKQLIGVYGAGSLGKRVMRSARLQHPQLDRESYVFIDDNSELTEVDNYPVLTYKEFLSRPISDKKVTIAIIDSEIREFIAERLIQDNLSSISIHDADLTLADNIELGEGSTLFDKVYLSPNAKIGKFFHADSESHIAQHCIVGDYVTFATKARCNDYVHIHDHAYIGAEVTIEKGESAKPIIIGRGAVIGKGAVVTKDVPADGVVVQIQLSQ